MKKERQRELAEQLGVHPSLLPPDSDAEKILEWVRDGRCHIERRGHGTVPLLVFDDGGAMELPSVRWTVTARGARLASAASGHRADRTAHYDVCGTVDTIRSEVEAGLDGDHQVDELHGLLADIGTMLRRMERRRGEYERFVQSARAVLDLPVRRKEVPPALGLLEELGAMLSDGSARESSGCERFVEAVEAVRDVAQYLEYSLSDYRAIAVKLKRLYEDVKGARSWPDEEEESG